MRAIFAGGSRSAYLTPFGSLVRAFEQCAIIDHGKPFGTKDSPSAGAEGPPLRKEDNQMNREQLRAAQQPLKDQYKMTPDAAWVTLKASGSLGENLTCGVETGRALVEAGLHPATGGSGLAVCSGDMLLQALVACAGVTLAAVATSMGIELRSAKLFAEGDLDFRGTLGVAKDTPVGFQRIRLSVELDTDASLEAQTKLLELTERYCVVYQTLLRGPETQVTLRK